MVTRANRPGFWSDEDGISLVEGLIALPLVVLVFSAFVEFGYAMFQWNQTVKAMQLGARMAAVSDPIAADFDPAMAASGGTAGDPITASGSWVCGPNQANCDAAGLARIVARMSAINGRIGNDNVVVSYDRSGLGYYGRPNGAVVTIRMEVRNITFELPILGAMLGLDDIEIPAMPVTVTSEDMQTAG